MNTGTKSEVMLSLRHKAEERIKKQHSKSVSQLNQIDTLKLIHELEVYHIELEMQIDELVKLNAEKDKLFSVLSHDLKGPFNSFLGLTEILENELDEMDHEKMKNLSVSLRKSATRVYQLVEDLLEWSRMQRGLIEYHPISVPLADVINKNIELLNEQVIQKDQKIKLHIEGTIYVKIDLTMLDSTLRNLISNAIKFSYRGGKISITAQPVSNNLIEIAITDDGMGISKSNLNEILKFNGNTFRKGTEGESSTGLGLLLCKDFIEKNGGTLHVISTEGKGSTFSFTLPASTARISSKQ